MLLPKRDFLGTGWSFPPRLNATGDIVTVSDVDDIEEAIRIILLTQPGERVMRPEFGSRLPELLFMPCNTTTCGLANMFVAEALTRWEPRIRIVDVRTNVDSSDSARLLIHIQYQVRTENSARNLVFPFYTIPGER